jgi:apolipoprotein N-acyltransferase
MIAFGAWRLAINGTKFTGHTVRIVQCNLSQKEKQNKALSLQNLKKHASLSKSDAKIDLIIWPEAAIPYLYHKQLSELHDFLRIPLKPGAHLLTGAVRQELETSKIYNSVVVINHLGQNVTNSDKIHLVPFGEYVPFRKVLPFQSIANDIGDFDVGLAPGLIELSGLKIVPAICYEAIFPLEFLPKDGDGDADVVVNVTNDAWFGFTSEPFQHLQIVRARAVELGIPVIRATNYGISAMFDPCGREIGRVPINQAGILDSHVPCKLPITPYRRHGDLVFWLMILLSFFLIFITRNRCDIFR